MASDNPSDALHPKALDQPGGSFGQNKTVDKLLSKIGVNVDKDLHGDRAAVAETAGLPVDAPEIQRNKPSANAAASSTTEPARTA